MTIGCRGMRWGETSNLPSAIIFVAAVCALSCILGFIYGPLEGRKLCLWMGG